MFEVNEGTERSYGVCVPIPVSSSGALNERFHVNVAPIRSCTTQTSTNEETLAIEVLRVHNGVAFGNE